MNILIFFLTSSVFTFAYKGASIDAVLFSLLIGLVCVGLSVLRVKPGLPLALACCVIFYYQSGYSSLLVFSVLAMLDSRNTFGGVNKL